MTTATLCIFARAPVHGRVKSRLAAEIGADAALAAHVELVEDTLARVADVDGVQSELWLDDIDHPVARAWAERWHLPLRRQASGDLGARMHRAIACCVEAGALGIVIGTDCPAIDAGYVRQAVAALAVHDVVLAPAADGGYGLVGARCPVPAIFQQIAWGTGSVLTGTLAAAAAARHSVALLGEIEDVDTAADWNRYLRSRARLT